MRIAAATSILALTIAAAPALAEDDVVNADIVNGQLNLGHAISDLNVTAYEVEGEVNATSAAIGNSFSGEFADQAQVNNYQRVRANIISTMYANIENSGDVNLTAAAVGNTASVHSHGGVPCPHDPEDCPELHAELSLTNGQQVDYVDPAAFLYVTASGVGSVNGTAAAIGNSLSVEAAGVSNSIDSYQRMSGPTGSMVNANISDAEGVNLTSAAVANTVSVDTILD